MMIRILQCVNIMDRAGLENMLMNYYRNIDRNVVQFDFLTHRPDKGAYDDEILSMGGRVFHAPRLYPQNYPTYFKWMREFFKEHPEYKIIHSHIDSMSYFPLLAAKKAEIPVRIAHSHSSKLDRDLKLPIKFIALKLIPTVANYNCACGDVAGKFMFGTRDFRIIKNAIDLEKFSFNSEIRDNKRDELGITNKFVIGHVGRFCYIKNQLFLLDIFKRILDVRVDAYLLLIGKGEDEKKIRDRIRDLRIEDKVGLLIDRADVDRLYQVMDVFVMPSLFEGLPVVGVEAQANGLATLFSDKISQEVLLTSNSKFYSINEDAQSWAEIILNMGFFRNKNAITEITEAGFEIKKEANKLSSFYLSIEGQRWN